MAHAVKHLDGVRVGPEVAAEVIHGRVLDLDTLGAAPAAAAVSPAGPWAVHDSAGELLAVYEPFRGAAKPAVVVAAR